MQSTSPKRQVKYVFICGAIASGIGKGVTNSSIGLLLKQYGYSVSFLKIDPYLNTDAGLMNPFEHGECFVTKDGGEVDLDLGNYERFIGMNLTFHHSLTTGKLFSKIIHDERSGKYLGRTVQIVPDVVNEIKEWVKSIAQIKVDDESENLPDFVLVEVGGTVGDLESTYYYEAVRQMILEEGHQNVALIMLTYIISLGGEQKTKPAQNGLKDLRYTGLQADFLVCRSQFQLNEQAQKKLALQGSLPFSNVFSVPDVTHTYDILHVLESQEFVQKVLSKLNLPIPQRADLSIYDEFKSYNEIIKVKPKLKIGVFGKYMANKDAYMSLFKALHEGAIECGINLEIVQIDLIQLESKVQLIIFNYIQLKFDELRELSNQMDGILVPGGFGNRGFEEKVFICKLARESKKPFLGICYGFQAAIVEYGRHIGYPDAQTEEKENDSTWTKVQNDNYFIIYMPEINLNYKGGNMRLGLRTTHIEDQDSLAYKIYGTNKVLERHRHRFEVNPSKIQIIEQAGGRFSGRDGDRMEIFELPEVTHPFYVGVQYHPEFTSKNFKPNALFVYFLKAANKNKPDGVLTMERRFSRPKQQ